MSRDIDWDDLDKEKYFVYGVIFSMGMRVFVYPPGVVKTRLQYQDHGANRLYKGTWDAIVKIARNEGIKGFYKGFPSFLVGTLPAQLVYISSLEYSRYVFRKSGVAGVGESHPSTQNANMRNFLAGGMASLVASSVTVPTDVVSQRLMIQDGVVNRSSLSGTAVLKQIMREEGLRGLYRGWGATIFVYAPNSAIWWSTYGFVKSHLARWFPSYEDSTASTAAVNAIAGASSGLTAATLTNPIDVCKTRMQVLDKNSPGMGGTIVRMARHMWKTEGLSAFARGVVPRVLSQVPVSILLIVPYEIVKQKSLLSSS